MRVCDLTGKGTRIGSNRSYSCVRTPRKFAPNLQWKVFTIKDRKIRLRVSTSVMRTINLHENFQDFLNKKHKQLQLSSRAFKKLKCYL